MGVSGGVTPNPTAQSPYLGPGGPGVCLAETLPRGSVVSTVSPGASTCRLAAVYLTAGEVVSYLGFATGTTAASAPTSSWLCLLNSSLVSVAATADAGSAAIAASSTYKYAVAKIASGSATSYTVPSSGVYYWAFQQVATTPASLLAGPASTTALLGLAPALTGIDTTGYATVPSVGTTFVNSGATANVLYGWLQ